MPASTNDEAASAVRLRDVLLEGARILDETARLCEEQRQALIANDSGRLGELSERAETLAARFRMIESARRELIEIEGVDTEAIVDARRRLTESAAAAAVAAASCSELLARSSAATAALRRVVESAESAGYLPSGEPRARDISRILEKRA